MFTIDIFRIYAETEHSIMSFPFSASLKFKLDDKISSIEEIEDWKMFQIQRECGVNLTKKDRAELQLEIDKFRNEEKTLAARTCEETVVDNMLKTVREYFIEKYSERFMRYIDTKNGKAAELESLIYNLSILEGRRCLRAILKVKNFSNEDIAFVMKNYAIARVPY